MKLSSMITISKYISPVTLSGDTTLTTTQSGNLNSTVDIVPPPTNEDRTIFVLAAFGIFLVLVGLLSFWYLHDRKGNKIKNSIHPKPQTDTQPSLPPVRQPQPQNSFYPNLDDTPINVYIPINNRERRNLNNDTYQETNAIYDDRPILNNFTYGNPEQEPNLHIDTTYIKDNEDNKNQNQNQNQNLFVSDHEYDEPEDFDEPPKLLSKKCNTKRRTRSKSNHRKKKSNEKRPWRPPSPNPVKEDYSVVERRRTRRKSRERSSISEYNVLDIDESKKRSSASTEYNVLKEIHQNHNQNQDNNQHRPTLFKQNKL